jgi:hypothetical protein
MHLFKPDPITTHKKELAMIANPLILLVELRGFEPLTF